MTNQESKPIFQEDVYDMLRKGNQGERYRKQSTDEAIRKILQDKRLSECLKGREIIWELYNVFSGTPQTLVIIPEEILRIAKKSKNGWNIYREMILKGGSLEFVLDIEFGEATPSYDTSPDEWSSYFNYTARAPIVLTREYDYPIIDLRNPVFKHKGIGFFLRNKNNPEYDPHLFKSIVKLFYNTQKSFLSLKGRKYKASDLIVETGKSILEDLGEQVAEYKKQTEYEIGEID